MTTSTLDQRTSWQQLVDFTTDHDLPRIRLRANETFVNGSVVDGVARVVVERYTVEDFPTYRKVTGHAVRIEAYRDIVGTWYRSPADDMTVADPEFEAVRIPKFSVKTVREQIESIRWARDCARPGSDKSPMAAYWSDDDRMPEKHWSL